MPNLSPELHHNLLKSTLEKHPHGDGLECVERKAEVEVEVKGRHVLDSDPAGVEEGALEITEAGNDH